MNADRSAPMVARTPVDRAGVAEVCERYGVAERSLIGLVARGEAGPDSDVDLLYVLAPGRHLGFSINRLEDELATLFGRPVDLVSKAALHRLIRTGSCGYWSTDHNVLVHRSAGRADAWSSTPRRNSPLEVKHHLSGQSVDHAIAPYQNDRDPRPRQQVERLA